jgi:hypothetical protein
MINADLNASRVILKHAAFALSQHLKQGQELSISGKNKPKPQALVRWWVVHVARFEHSQHIRHARDVLKYTIHTIW